MADGSRRPIEEVGVGDEVLSSYGAGAFRPALVTDAFASHDRREGVAITMASGRRLVSTPEHVHFAGRARGGDASDCRRTTVRRITPARGDTVRRRTRHTAAACAQRCRRAELRFASAGHLLDAAGRLAVALGAPALAVGDLGRGSALPFRFARDVRPGMVMFDERGGYDMVVRTEPVALDAPVHDLNVEATHNFIANGLVTHNSIYSFRGADIGNILNFEDDYPDAHVIKLEQNYRSTQTILSAANAVIAHNREQKPKSLWTEQGDGEPIRVRELDDDRAEARYVVGEIERLVDEGASRAEIAVFYRMNSQSRQIEQTLVASATSATRSSAARSSSSAPRSRTRSPT